MTLLELLVVVLILLMVTAAAIPIVAPAMQNRQMREAARLASSYFAQARSRAIETGRPVGVMIERFNGLPFGLVLSQVEVPPPYSGDTTASRITINTTNAQIADFVPAGGDIAWKGLVRYGDQVKLNFRGPTYVLASIPGMPSGFVDPDAGKAVIDPPATNNWFLVTQTGQVPVIAPAYGTATGVPFQIVRQPARSSTAPLQLPEGAVIDLVSSGISASGSYGATFGNAMPYDPIVLFSPAGRLEAVSLGTTGTLTRPTDAMYFLLGRRDLMPDATPTNEDENLWDPPPKTGGQYLANFWIAIGYQTGLVTVAENSTNVGPTDLANARDLAISGQSVGGN